MEHRDFYIQYHNADNLGFYPHNVADPETPVERLKLDNSVRNTSWINTKKKQVENTIGDFCFLIVGKTDRELKKYYLWSFFRMTTCKPDEDGFYNVFGKGFNFENPILLSSLSEFNSFKSFCGQFGLGFQLINSHPFVKVLHAFAKREMRKLKVTFRSFSPSLHFLESTSDHEADIVSSSFRKREMKISKGVVPTIYDLSKKAFEGEMSEKEVVNKLVSDNGMNASSAKDYVRNFRCMCEGQKFTRTNNAYAVQYYIDNIHKDYGDEALSRALKSLMQHIEYIESIRKVRMRRLSEIYDEYIKKITPINEQDRSVAVGGQTLDEIPVEYIERLKEGAKRTITVNAYERNEKAKKICKTHWGTVCSVCSFNFGAYYGAMGEGYIHVHHLTPLSEIGLSYEVDPIKDLRPVCPNCHAMLHRGSETMSIEELQKLILSSDK